MVEVFTTNIWDDQIAKKITAELAERFGSLAINFDLERQAPINYPNEHNILRAEGQLISPKEIIGLLKDKGFECDVLE